jgi:CRISPR-associated RAMP protein (TIGR02581 family)
MRYGDFDQFKVKYLINLELTNESSLSIGMGKALWGAVDNPIIKKMDGLPYIPGSSVKGVLRAEAERYARSVYGINEVCDILNPTGPQGEERKQKDLGEKYEPCVICRIFGGPTIASHLTVYDAYPTSSYSIEVRRRVSINRLTGGQHPGRLFEVEQVDPKVHWDLRLEIENIDIIGGIEENDNKRIKEILNHLMRKILVEGVALGGKRSVGLGLVKGNLKGVKRFTIKDGKYFSEDVTETYRKILEVS